MIRGVIFDKDGTLFDFHRTWAGWTERLLDSLSGGDPGLAVRLGQAVGFDRLQGFAPDSPIIASTPWQIADRLVPCLPGIAAAALVARMDRLSTEAEQIEAVPLGPLMQVLRGRGLRIGLATNDSEAPARAHLQKAGITTFFDAIYGYDTGPRPKPAPDTLLAFAARCNLAPAEVVMVGDSLHDLIAGRAAGMACVGVLTGLADRRTLAAAADAVLDNIGMLPDWLDDFRP
jgi:phosphoglycolate phosphatase